ncbi:MAG TPA: hypothetical protein VHX43_13290 [Xanthobacteraceae bacterium]|jgi:hypothetical protein|nr:hypothetical protein [Xanthobacteraceae bacterium]
MAYIGTADAAHGLLPGSTRPDRALPRRSFWRRAFARVLTARRQAAEREVAEFVRLSGLKPPESAARLRRIVPSRAAP